MEKLSSGERWLGAYRMLTLKTLVLAIALVGAGFLGGCSSAPAAPTPTPQPMGPPFPPTPTPTPPINIDSISIENFSFKPPDLTVPKGTVVLWTNYDDVDHNVIGPDFSLGPFGKSQAWAHTFNAEGNFSYYCNIHPSMKGSVTVRSR